MKFINFSFFNLLFIFWIGVLIFYIGSMAVRSDCRYMKNKVEIYEKILNREYNRTFDSYEDYLVYRIEIGK